MVKYKTEQRKLLLDFFTKHPHEMFSAKEIVGLLGEVSVSISAVYRNLSELETSGLVRRSTKSGARESYYQYTGVDDCRNHIHMTCKKCGKTIHMSHEDTETLAQSVLKYKDFTIDKSDTVLLGLCGNCREGQNVR